MQVVRRRYLTQSRPDCPLLDAAQRCSYDPLVSEKTCSQQWTATAVLCTSLPAVPMQCLTVPPTVPPTMSKSARTARLCKLRNVMQG